MTAPAGQTALIIGASRGLGYALTAEYLARGWQVTATVREAGQTRLHDLARSSAGRLVVETVDITVPEQVAALHDRLAQATFDLLFVNAGVTNGPEETVADVSTDTFVRLMVTNALSPMRVVEALRDPAAPLTIGQSIPGVADTIEAQAGRGGLQYLDYRGQPVRW
jgi:NAD(P)-dependent dehydrogenase (short-subunit alcohol dehydrogenase family)